MVEVAIWGKSNIVSKCINRKKYTLDYSIVDDLIEEEEEGDNGDEVDRDDLGED